MVGTRARGPLGREVFAPVETDLFPRHLEHGNALVPKGICEVTGLHVQSEVMRVDVVRLDFIVLFVNAVGVEGMRDDLLRLEAVKADVRRQITG